MLEMIKENPFPALFDDIDKGYPKSEMGYVRAYIRNGLWNSRYFPVGEFNQFRASEFDDIYRTFVGLCSTKGKMRNMCQKKAKRIEDWCGEEQYEAFLETPRTLYRFVMRFAPGDYNLYLHCYDRFQIPWSDEQWIKDRVMENYECIEEAQNSAHFDFNVSLSKKTLLKIYAEVQKEINGDDVSYPDNIPDEKYVGNYADFLLSFNGKDGYGRTSEEIDHLEFIL